MSIFYAGDTHGYLKHFHRIETEALKEAHSAIVQVGDFGILWPGGGKKMVSYFEKRTKRGIYTAPWYFCDGNHDNHDALDALHAESDGSGVVEVAPNCFHVKRGTVLEIDGKSHIFCGGAKSTDRQDGRGDFTKSGHRVWWPQEDPSREDLELFNDNFNLHKPEVVVTHDAPYTVDIYRTGRFDDPTPRAFDMILRLSEHKPKLWLFGHHHIFKAYQVEEHEGIDFRCCGFHGQGWVF